jgi:hypothetical protein
MKQWAMILMGIGVLTLVLGGVFLLGSKDEHDHTRFWAVLLQNCVYFLLVVNASMFFICATTLAWGGWQMAFRRVPEAISAAVPVVGGLTLVVLLLIVFTDQHHIYHWLDHAAVEKDPILKGKSGFLSKGFFVTWTVVTIGLWSILGMKMRSLSRSIDNTKLNVEEGRRYIFKNTVWASVYIVFFALTVASTIPWLWLMSIDSHWYSTMYSWYTFASTFVAGMSLVALFVVYLKNNNYLELVNDEHLHDIGKFMFAFSVFWTYLWFSQYMLIWYANIPEETVYFKPRVQGPYKGIFFLNLILNFITPFLLLMRKSAKRNYTTITILAVVIIFGHWIDFYQMVMPGTMGEHAHLSWYELGIAAGIVGIIIWNTGRVLSKHPLLAKNHPLTKESIVYHT